VDRSRRSEAGGQSVEPSQADLLGARRLYDDKCVECHGDPAKVTARRAKMYDPQPANFTDAAHMIRSPTANSFTKLPKGHRPCPAFKKTLQREQRWQLGFLRHRSLAQPAAE